MGFQSVRVSDFISAEDIRTDEYSWKLRFTQNEEDRWCMHIGLVTPKFNDWSKPIGRDKGGNAWSVNVYNGYSYYADKFKPTFEDFRGIHSGDVVTVTIDFKRSTMRVKVGQDDFAEFRGVGGNVALACTLYEEGDMIELIDQRQVHVPIKRDQSTFIDQ